MSESFWEKAAKGTARVVYGKQPERTTAVGWNADEGALVPRFYWWSWFIAGLCVVLPSIAIFILVTITYFWDMHKSTSSSQKFLEPFFWWVWFIASFAIAFVLWVLVHIVHFFSTPESSINLDDQARSLGLKGLNALYAKLSGALFITWAIYLFLFGFAWNMDDKCVAVSPSIFTQSKMMFEAAYDQKQSNCVVMSRATIVLAIVGIGIIILTIKKAFFDIWNFFFIASHGMGAAVVATIKGRNPIGNPQVRMAK